MDLTHRFHVPASVEETWTAFNHLDRLAPCFPGATVSSSNGDHFEGSMKVKIGPLALVFNGSGRFLERDAVARRLVFETSGADRRGNGTATATVTASLVGDDSGTEVELRTDLDFTGRPAQFGRDVVSDVSDKLFDQFVSCVSGRFAEGMGAPGPEDLVAAAPTAADDELWEEWAIADDSADDGDEAEPSDIEQTVEMVAVRSTDDDSDVVTDEVWLAEDDTAPVEDETRVEEEATQPPSPPTAPPPPWRYSPPSDLSQPAASVLANVVSTVLRRYGPLLGFLSLMVLIVIKLINRRRR
jgi:uncharacterized protein